MNGFFPAQDATISARFKQLFRTREFFVHDGASLRRLRVDRRMQVAFALVVAALIGWSIFAAVQMARGTMTPPSAQAQVKALNVKVAAIEADAKAHAARLERRQAFLAALLSGEGNRAALAKLLPREADATGANNPLRTVEQRQYAFADAATDVADARYRNTVRLVKTLGLSPARLVKGGMGGPFEPIDSKAVVRDADPKFKALFMSWTKLDRLEQGVMAVPSRKPVAELSFTSFFGVRSDPFRGGAAMHAGVDIPGPTGTPIYATADGIIGRAGWSGGYGNLVEVDHGHGIQTRYGHLSQILVTAGSRVKRGDLIARMGSTGRSTGSHLHYEVRLDGRAVNPMPFLQSADYVLAVQARAGAGTAIAQGGPAD